MRQIWLVAVLVCCLPVWAWADHEHVKELKDAGKILPLETLLEKSRKYHAGKLLEVELEEEDGRLLYEIEVLDDSGIVWEMYFDAKTGELVKDSKE